MITKWINKIRKATLKRGFVCDCCQGELFDYPQTRICAECEEKLLYNDKHTCTVCGRMSVTEGVCLICKQHPPAFIGVSPYVYIGETASTIVRIKNGNRRLACALAERMVEELIKQCAISGCDIVVLPIPMSERKQAVRGYNQALDLAEVVEERLQQAGYQVALHTDVLVKQRETPQQKHLTMRERRANLQGVFHLAKRALLKDKTVLLVDDIMTTGATGDVCATLCKNAGAKEVYFLCVAAAPEKQP